MRGKGEGAIYRVPADTSKPLKYWTAVVELPPLDGKRRRKPIRSKDKKVVVAKLADLKAELRTRGDLPTAGQTVEQWMTYWLNEIAAKEVRPNTLEGYVGIVRNHIVPAIGKVQIEKLSAAHMRRVYDSMTAKGLSSTTALLAHRTMSVSFGTAVREGRLGRNPAKLTRAPRKAVAPQEAFELEEALAVLEHVAKDPVLGARWATSFLTGARRGEVIGLERDRITDEIDLSWQLQRMPLTGADGKPDVPADFEYRHLTGGLYLTRPKSSAGWRIIPMFEPLRTILERYLASTPPNEYGLVFAIDGKPIDPSRDTKNWRKVLAETGIERDVKLHGVRHTTVDLLFYAGVPEDLIQEIVGHSTRAQSRSYKSRGATNRKRLAIALEAFSNLFIPPADGRSGTRAIDE